MSLMVFSIDFYVSEYDHEILSHPVGMIKGCSQCELKVLIPPKRTLSMYGVRTNNRK